MAKATARPQLDVRVLFEVTEVEARALDAMAGYGDDAFVKAFYDKLGAAYMRDHEAGLRSFLSTIREIVGPALHQVDLARQLLTEAAIANGKKAEGAS